MNRNVRHMWSIRQKKTSGCSLGTIIIGLWWASGSLRCWYLFSIRTHSSRLQSNTVNVNLSIEAQNKQTTEIIITTPEPREPPTLGQPNRRRRQGRLRETNSGTKADASYKEQREYQVGQRETLICQKPFSRDRRWLLAMQLCYRR